MIAGGVVVPVFSAKWSRVSFRAFSYNVLNVVSI